MEKELDTLISTVINEKNFSEGVKEATLNVIIDTLIASIYGLETEEEVNNLIDERKVKNGIFIPGRNEKLNVKDTLLALGSATVANELDEGNTMAKGHPSAHIFPIVYATAIENNNTFEEVLDAYIKSYEISSRMAMTFQMKDDMHPHGTWGNVGGAVARALLTNKSEKEIKNVIELVLSLPLATNWQAAEQGQSVRNLYTGIGNVLAYESVDYVKFGFQSNSSVVESLWSKIMGDNIMPNKLIEGIFDPPLITNNYYKVYPTCRFTHAAIESVETIMKDKEISIDSIDSITINTYSLAARCDSSSIKTRLQSKFSIPYAVSCSVMGLDLYEDFSKNLQLIGAFIDKVVVNEDEGITAQLPGKRAAECIINLDNGEKLTHFVGNAKGEFSNPFTDDEMIQKYLNMLTSKKELDKKWLLNLKNIDYKLSFKDWLSQNKII